MVPGDDWWGIYAHVRDERRYWWAVPIAVWIRDADGAPVGYVPNPEAPARGDYLLPAPMYPDLDPGLTFYGYVRSTDGRPGTAQSIQFEAEDYWTPAMVARVHNEAGTVDEDPPPTLERLRTGPVRIADADTTGPSPSSTPPPSPSPPTDAPARARSIVPPPPPPPARRSEPQGQ